MLDDLTMLLHQWLGHTDKKGLRVMHNKGIVQEFHECSSEFHFYEHCVYGKHNHMSFTTGATREKEILELVHSDDLELHWSHH